MIAEQLIRHVCSPDPLDEAKERVQTRQIATVIRERKVMVHAALKRGIVPTEGRERPAGHRVAS